jgi:cytidine deaminase
MKVEFDVRKNLIEAALSVRKHAYAPYSHYPVGAAVLTQSGKIYTGVNVENAAYPSSICAERTAIFKAVTDGEHQFIACAVVTDNGGSPCGACRQVMAEFGLDLLVIIANRTGEVVTETTIRQLLPLAFQPEDLIPED